jgi:hypothetical protein
MKASVPLTLASRVRASEDVLFQKLNQEAVLLHLKSGVYFGLDQIGTNIWMILPVSDSLQQVADSITKLYDVSQERSARDLLELIQEMIQHQLVTVVEA